MRWCLHPRSLKYFETPIVVHSNHQITATSTAATFFSSWWTENPDIDSCLKPLYNGHLFTMATFFCPSVKVVVVERFNCILLCHMNLIINLLYKKCTALMLTCRKCEPCRYCGTCCNRPSSKRLPDKNNNSNVTKRTYRTM